MTKGKKYQYQDYFKAVELIREACDLVAKAEGLITTKSERTKSEQMVKDQCEKVWSDLDDLGFSFEMLSEGQTIDG